jgi:hypothetical protein
MSEATEAAPTEAEEPKAVDLKPHLEEVAGLEARRLAALGHLVDVCPCGELERRLHDRGDQLQERLDVLKLHLATAAKDDEAKDVEANLAAIVQTAEAEVASFEDAVQDATDLPESDADATARLVIATEDLAKSVAKLAALGRLPL